MRDHHPAPQRAICTPEPPSVTSIARLTRHLQTPPRVTPTSVADECGGPTPATAVVDDGRADSHANRRRVVTLCPSPTSHLRDDGRIRWLRGNTVLLHDYAFVPVPAEWVCARIIAVTAPYPEPSNEREGGGSGQTSPM